MLITFKKVVKKIPLTDFIFRKCFLLLPLHVREKLSNVSNEPYSGVEDKYNFIMVHIPKCAGNAVMRGVFGVKGQGHNTLQQYKHRDIDKYLKYTKFAVIREPLSRFQSAFYYLKQGGMGTYDEEFCKVYIKELTINEFITKLKVDKKFQTRVFEWTHFKTQASYVLDEKNFCDLDIAINYAHIDYGIEHIAKVMGLKTIGQLPKVNVTKVCEQEAINKENELFLKLLYDGDFRLYDELFRKNPKLFVRENG